MSGLYQGYAYAYPHKSAYRPFPAPMPLADIWRGENLDRAFLYLHVPFCEMRCGFCNLFTMVGADGDLAERYLQTLDRQAEAVGCALPHLKSARIAFGGGTPTWLSAGQLARVFDLLERHLGARPSQAPTSVETSPSTATPERLVVLAEHGVERISIGVQSFDPAESKAMGRPQRAAEVEMALDSIRANDFPCLNIDLIYGAAVQTPDSWLASLKRGMAWRPEEVFLYPLYVRPLTGLDGKGPPPDTAAWDAHRLALYRLGRDFLRSEGYAQVSMRCFSKAGVGEVGDAYCCQDDAMIGLGPGARSYARRVHYSSRYAVRRAGVKRIIEGYCDQADFSTADYGALLDDAEQRRRFVLQSIFRAEGLDLARFSARFGVEAVDAAPVLRTLLDDGMLERSGDRLIPTASGLEHSDQIGPAFYSEAVSGGMRAFELT